MLSLKKVAWPQHLKNFLSGNLRNPRFGSRKTFTPYSRSRHILGSMMSCRNIPCPNPRQGGCGRRWGQEALQSAMDTNVPKKCYVVWFWDLSPICFRAERLLRSGIEKAAMGFIKFVGLWVKDVDSDGFQSPPDLILEEVVDCRLFADFITVQLSELRHYTGMMELDIR